MVKLCEKYGRKVLFVNGVCNTRILPHGSKREIKASGRLLLVYMEFGANGSDFARTRLAAKKSADEGETWSLPQTTGLRTPGSCPELTRIPGTGDLLMIWNNSDYDPGFRSHQASVSRRPPPRRGTSAGSGEHIRDIESDPSRAPRAEDLRRPRQ